jgi:hypothetical protein
VLKKLLFLLVLAAAGSQALAQNAPFWTPMEERQVLLSGIRQIIPQSYRTYRLDLAALEPMLAQAPRRFGPDAGAGILITLPMPDGQPSVFRLWETPVMHPDLQARYPQIRCYTGKGVTDPTATLKADLTPAGFHAMVVSARSGSWFIDPFQTGDRTTAIAYFKKDFQTDKRFKCEMDEALAGLPLDGSPEPEDALLLPGDCQLRVYRLALACTGEYAQFHGGTVPLVMAAFNTTMNRVNGLAETDGAITMELVPNNDTLIFFNAATDPYTNNSGNTMLNQNQTVVNARIGSANYDIGHVFSTGGGGIAGGIGVVCKSNKAQGVTGSPQPIGDPFDVDYVIHEMGHQFAGTHTYNSCGGNGNSTGVEAGSGTSIMAYAGICNNNENVLSNSEAFFHGINLPQIAAYMVTGTGNSCPVRMVTGNNAPTVEAGPNYTIPKSTPFALTAIASDPDGDILTYGWEQMDAQTVSASPQPTNATGPMFRAFAPVESPTRTFPRRQELLNNGNYAWEKLPSVARTLKFRVTVRDNFAGAGCNDQDDMTVTVNGSAGPFLVTYPNTNVTWMQGENRTVTWNVAGTDLLPINCDEVRILLSTDGGLTFPLVLAENVPNSGTANVDVPFVLSTTCRIKIESVGNIFFDLSNQNFRIDPPPVPTFSLSATPPAAQICSGEAVTFPVQTQSILGFSDSILFVLNGLPAGAVATITPNPALPGDLVEVTIDNLLPASAGAYTMVLTGVAGAEVRNFQFSTTLVPSLLAGPTALTAPADGAANLSVNPILSWEAVPGAISYQVQVATNPAFTPGSIVRETTVGVISQSLTGLTPATVHYWRVRAFNFCNPGEFSSVNIFRTAGAGGSQLPVGQLLTNAPLIVVQGGDGAITPDYLWFDQSGSPNQVVYQITAYPEHGMLSGPNGTLELGATFTQADLENSQVAYTHGGDDAAGDSFEFSVVDQDNQAWLANQTFQIAVLQNTLAATAAVSQALDCFGAFDGQITVNATGGTPPLLYSLNGGSPQASATFSGLAAGTYTVVVGDANGFTLSAAPVQLDSPAALTLATDVTGSDLTLIAAGGTGVLTYSLDGQNFSADPVFEGLPDGAYTATVLDQNGCTASVLAVVAVNGLVAGAEVEQQVACPETQTGVISATAGGGTAPYTFSLDGQNFGSSNVFANLAAGTYTVTVRDANGTEVTAAPIILTAPAPIAVTAAVSSDVITVAASGGAGPLQYSLDGQNFQLTPVFSGLANGTYTVTVRDANGCTAQSDEVEVAVVPLAVSAEQTGDILCHGEATGELTLTATGGLAPFQYRIGFGAYQDSPLFDGLPAGTYTVKVKDALGQTASATVTIEQPEAVAATAAVLGRTITVTAGGGTGALLYALDNGLPQTSNVFTQVANGPHTVVVTDANGCSSTVIATVNYQPMTATFLITGLDCFGDMNGQIQVSVSGGLAPYEYSLNGGAFQTSFQFTGLAGGTYTIAVRDAEGEILTSNNVQVFEPSEVTVLAAATMQTVTANGSGGTPPYLYSLDGGTYQSSPTFENVGLGSHTITVRDDNGCTGSGTVEVIMVGTVEPQSAWGLTVMPNPGPGLFEVSMLLPPPSGGLRLEVSDAAGRRLRSLELSGSYGTIDLSGYPAGVYFLRAFDGERMGTVRLVVQR